MRQIRAGVAACAVVASLIATAAQAEETAATRILIAYHSESGNTATFAKALADGAAEVEGVEVTLRDIADATDDEIRNADGILVGTPVHWGSLNARVKDFLDRTGRVLDQEVHGEGKTAGAFCTGGAVSAGKELARLAILSAFMNMRFVAIGGLQSDGFGNLGPEATTGPADPGLSDQELAEARASGERFARITASHKRGRAS